MWAGHPVWSHTGRQDSYRRALLCCYNWHKRVSASIVDNRRLSGYLMDAAHEGRSSIEI